MDEILRFFDDFLSKHPGYLGWQNGALEAIHADWPAYPSQHGENSALESLACFPAETHFIRIDSVDSAVLLAAVPLVDEKDVYSDRNLHLSVWWQDLVSLAAARFVGGLLTQREHVFEFWHRQRPVFSELPEPIPEEYADHHGAESSISQTGVFLKPEAFHELNRRALISLEDLDPELLSRVMPLVLVDRHDAAVRDACILLETRLRQISGSREHGQRIVDIATAALRRIYRVPEGMLRALRAELRAVFKFTRNEYAHNLVDASAEQGAAILLRISRLLQLLQVATAERAV
jgi:hypothetical protein